MIYTYFSGGLGNQLFQYAYTRSYQIKYGGEVTYFLSSYEKDKQRRFVLDNFNINRDWKRVDNDMFIQSSFKFRLMIKRIFDKLTRAYEISSKSTESFGYIYILKQFIMQRFGIYYHWQSWYMHPIKSVFKDQYIYGMWHSYMFFKDIKTILLEELKVMTPISFENKKILDEIKFKNSVCLHIRRGDYVKLSGYLVCDLDYYIKGINMIKSKTDNPTFFIFSDDVKWAKENLNGNENFVFVEHCNEDYEDFRLMLACKHFIISNSTFSWWAQYLCTYLNKLVVAPCKWYSDGKTKKCIYLKNWILT